MFLKRPIRFNLPVYYEDLSIDEKRQAREQYAAIQENKCYWCGVDLDEDPPEEITRRNVNWNFFPEGFLDNPVHLQHCHRTGLTEGAVHAYCNAVMWQFYGR